MIAAQLPMPLGPMLLMKNSMAFGQVFPLYLMLSFSGSLGKGGQLDMILKGTVRALVRRPSQMNTVSAEI
jgi:hypothetical protein